MLQVGSKFCWSKFLSLEHRIAFGPPKLMDVLFINFRSFRGLTCFAPRFAFRTGVLGYTKRPSSFVKPFPDPALFHPRNGRRLEAEEDLPERVHFEVRFGADYFLRGKAGVRSCECSKVRGLEDSEEVLQSAKASCPYGSPTFQKKGRLDSS